MCEPRIADSWEDHEAHVPDSRICHDGLSEVALTCTDGKEVIVTKEMLQCDSIKKSALYPHFVGTGSLPGGNKFCYPSWVLSAFLHIAKYRNCSKNFLLHDCGKTIVEASEYFTFQTERVTQLVQEAQRRHEESQKRLASIPVLAIEDDDDTSYMEPDKKTLVCKQWAATGRCNHFNLYGYCNYAHYYCELSRGRPMCRDFAKGSCRYGESCQFRHSNKDDKQPVPPRKLLQLR